MVAKLINSIIKFLSITLMGIILISVLTDFRADMFVLGGGEGKRAEEPRENNQTQTINQPTLNSPSVISNSISGASVSGINNGNEHLRNTSINPLTGLGTTENITQNRPVAISISNQRDALPTNATNGISEADIVYEFLVEGGGTRFIGIFQDFTNVGVVGSIRSARHYMVEIIEAYDALFIHAGGSPLGFEEIDNRDITAFDAVRGRRNQIFNRDVNRIPGHTLQNYHGQTTSGALFSRWLPTYDIRLTHSDRFVQALFFTDNPIPTGKSSEKITVKYSSAKSSTFNYDKAQNLYYMTQYGSQFRDANNNAAVAFTNLIIIETPVDDLVGHGEGAGRQDMSTVGRGTGYFASAGKYIKINWFRADKSSQYIYTDEYGNILELGRGKTYIGIVPTGIDTVFN